MSSLSGTHIFIIICNWSHKIREYFICIENCPELLYVSGSVFLFISSFNFISILNKPHRYLQSPVVLQRGFVQLYWQNIKVPVIQNICIFKLFVLCCRFPLHMLSWGFVTKFFEHVLFFISGKKTVPTVNDNYIYISLLFAAYFSFCAKPLSGNKKYIKKTITIQPLRLILFQTADITTFPKIAAV